MLGFLCVYIADFKSLIKYVEYFNLKLGWTSETVLSASVQKFNYTFNAWDILY